MHEPTTSTPQPYRVSLPFRALNAAGARMGRSALRAVAPLDVDVLSERARRRTGLTDPGEGWFWEGLRVLSAALEDEAELALLGRLGFGDEIERQIANRLLLREDVRREPRIAEQRTPRPVFIVGYPRTGTTLLHNLMTLHPEAHAPRLWRLYAPSPPVRPKDEARDPRRAAARRRVHFAHAVCPIFRTIHELSADGPEECVFLMQNTLVPYVRAETPSFLRWALAQDLVPDYLHHRRQLQVMQWWRPEGRWVLKSPFHLPAIAALLEVYPDACIVMTHRDPLRVVPSFCSLVAAARAMHQRRVEPREVGPKVLELLGVMMDRFLEARARLDPARFFDASYEELTADPIGVVRRIHERFGLGLDGAVAARLEGWMREHPQHRCGVHRYALDDFGLTERKVLERFGGYLERFGELAAGKRERS
ncbi:sulfotransferase family protein [Sorangium sp. So ce1078]|uniref:sulfotransferase family protein n=1 Tax=Sorangium sp. So ce1078 TaxID=3133329 RepID=UPI003F61982B